MRPSFASLWNSYPIDLHPCSDPYDNQCAIRMSIALMGAGFDFSRYSDPRCKHGHARGAESLANYLWHQLARPMIFATSTTFHRADNKKKGIVFFKDITGFRDGLGDHIDLWDQHKTKTGEYSSVSQQTWFWELT